MKKSRIALMLTLSLTIALGAALLARNWLQARMNAGEAAQGTMVVAAAMEIPFGDVIEATQVRLVEMPTALVPAKSFDSVEAVIGRVATQVLYPGEVLIEGRVVQHMGGSALAATVDRGMRAVTVRVDDVVGVAGFLLPGNHVDVVATKRENGARAVSSETILANIKVLAVDQIASPDKNDPVIVQAVTLEVRPEQAEVLVRATQEGKVQLTLRNPLDRKSTIAKASAPEPVAKAAPEPVRRVYRRPSNLSVTVIRGTAVSETRVKE
jgi:pilus assembly protein CpaB